MVSLVFIALFSSTLFAVDESERELSVLGLHRGGFDSLKKGVPTLDELVGTWEKITEGSYAFDLSDERELCYRKYLRFVRVANSSTFHLETSDCDRKEKHVARNIELVADDTYFWGEKKPDGNRLLHFDIEGTYVDRYQNSNGEAVSETERGFLSYNHNPIATLTECAFYLPVYFACRTRTYDDSYGDEYAIFISRNALKAKNPEAMALKAAKFRTN